MTDANEKVETVIVTGAGGALGRVVAGRFLDAGCKVVGMDRSLDHRGEVRPDDERDGLFWVGADLSHAEQVRDAISVIREGVGEVDVLVNCAGGFRWTLIDDVSDDDLDFLIDANLRSALLLTRELVPKMKERNFGRVVLISSKSTQNPGAGEGPYAATKAALNALTAALAAEVKEHDVTVNAVLPSIIDTPNNRDEMPDADFDKWVGREQLAEIIFSLTGKVGEPINGALIPVANKT